MTPGMTGMLAAMPLDGISDVTSQWTSMLNDTFNSVATVLGVVAGIALLVAVIAAVVMKNDAEKEGQIKTLIWILGAVIVGVLAYSLINWAMGGSMTFSWGA